MAGRVFWVVVATIFVDNVLFTMVVPALPVFADRYALSDSVAVAIFLAFPVAQLAVAVAAGRASDRFGRRPVILGSAVLMLVATLMFAAATGVATLVLARALQGAAAGLAWTAGIAALCDVFPPEQLGYRIALAQTAGGGAGLLGPALGGPLIDAFGTGAAFALMAVLPLALCAAALTIPETVRPGTRTPPVLPALRRLSRQPAARGGALALATMAAVIALLEPLVPLDLDDRFDMSATGVGLVFAAWLAAFFVSAPLAGRWSDRRGRRAPVLAGGAVVALALPAVPLAPSPGTVVVALVGVGVGLGMLAASPGPLLSEAVDRAGMGGNYGLSSSVLTMVFSLGYIVGPAAAAVAAAVTTFAVIAAAAAVSVAVLTTTAARQLTRAGRLRPVEEGA